MQVKLLKDVEYVGKKDAIVVVGGAEGIKLITDKLARELTVADVTAMDNVRTVNQARAELGMEPFDPKPTKIKKPKESNGKYEEPVEVA